MATENKILGNIPLIVLIVSQIGVIGAIYGTWATQMESTSESLKGIVVELKAMNQHITENRESDIRLKLQQEYNDLRLIKLESK